MIDLPAASGESVRVAEAHARARERLHRQRRTLRPLALLVVVAVVGGAFGTSPRPGSHGVSLAVTLVLAAFAGALVVVLRSRAAAGGGAAQLAVILVLGATAVALAALQARGATALAGAAAVWTAVARLPTRAGVLVGAAITVALDVASAIAGGSADVIFATTLLCALLGLVAYYVDEARDSQERTELLLAQLEDAREEQLHSAALAERGRIAGELHDVLAHSLSGAAIQLQGARVRADREGASGELREAIDRSAQLVRDGLADAREAVGALRGDDLPGVDELASLLDGFRRDLHVDATLTVEGEARTLPADAGLALYRGAQEALTNVARYAPGAAAAVRLRYEDGRTTLSVENASRSGGEGLGGVGGGRGLEGMRERLERAGGRMHAGPTQDGWRVQLEVPA